MSISAICRHRTTPHQPGIIWSVISCLGLDAVLDLIPVAHLHISRVIGCLLDLLDICAISDHDQLWEVIRLPLDALASAVHAARSHFIPHLRRTMEGLKSIFERIPVGCEAGRKGAYTLIGHCITAVGGREFDPYHAFAIQQILRLEDSSNMALRLTGFRVLATLTSACKGTMSPYLKQLLPMHLDSLSRDEPEVQASGEFQCALVRLALHLIPN